jgi:DNA-binding PadR family transcriptional regulator
MMSSKPVMSVRHAILVLLSEGPKSSQQLCEELEARAGEVCPVNVDQVYATLRRLERDGLVESDSACEESPQEGIRITA